MTTPHEQAGDLIQPILDVMAGADGGVAFARLRHSLLPDVIAKQGVGGTNDDFLKMVEQFSRLCQLMLDSK